MRSKEGLPSTGARGRRWVPKGEENAFLEFTNLLRRKPCECRYLIYKHV